jgi:hypothetical protein
MYTTHARVALVVQDGALGLMVVMFQCAAGAAGAALLLACSPQFLVTPPKAVDGGPAGQPCAFTGAMHSTATCQACLCGYRYK